LGEYIEEINIRNTDAKLGGDRLYGINSDGSFISSIANQEKLDLTKYKIVQKYDFCYTLRIIIGSIALYMAEKPCIVSTSYPVFRIKYDKRKMLNAEFLNIIFRRKEFHRYAKVNSWGSAKDNFSLEDLFNYKIPLPPKEVQESIVNLYRCLESAKQIAQKAREEMKTICPALVQRAKEIN
jgi:type I restriction enzyme S subunit